MAASAQTEVQDIFAKIDLVIGTFHNEFQPWVRAIVDAYRVRVRHLMTRAAAKSEDPEVLVEALLDVHNMSVANLEMRRRKDGRFVVKFPRDEKGDPFRLEK